MTHENKSNTFVFLAAIAVVLLVAIVLVILWVQTLLPGGGAQSSQGAAFEFHSGRRVKLQPAFVLDETAGTTLTSEVESAGAEGTSEESAAADSAGVDLDEVIAAINKGGCTACHTIPDIPGAVGVVGPNLANIGVAGAERIPGYEAEAYIRESLVEPNAFTAPECPTGPCITGVMPEILLEDAEVDVIVSYLATLGTGG
ncbi:MAG: hypothetical protein OES12_07330 [Anaerolineae bacterium]|nr:hypothetical protein [Anaerolineae bacterium]